MIPFGEKHLNDLFVMDGLQSVSARDKILREIVSNSLAHRDFSNAFHQMESFYVIFSIAYKL